jgi:carboxylesterase
MLMTQTPKIMPGAEPASMHGNRNGALILHGYTGCPQSMRPLAEAFAAAGFSVELPRLPGHGTTVEDMANYRWSDWTATVEAAYRDLAARCDHVIVAGLSMGGALTLWLAAKFPAIAGIVVINPAVETDDFQPLANAAAALLASGEQFMLGVAGDVADPQAKELGYDRLPTATVKPLIDGLSDVKSRLATIKCPALLLHSPQDHVVPPGSMQLLRTKLGGPFEYVELLKSYHVATLDFDKDEINRRAVAFAEKICSG